MRSRSWFDVGAADAKAGKDYRPPEHYSCRCQYRLGYESVKEIVYDMDRMFPFVGDSRTSTD